jgi:hypothetical protein
LEAGASSLIISSGVGKHTECDYEVIQCQILLAYVFALEERYKQFRK